MEVRPRANQEVSRASRARVGVALVIVADGMFSASLAAGTVYLAALNVLGQYRPANESAAPAIIGLLLSLLPVAAAACYWWGTRGLRSADERRFITGLRLALGLIGVAFVGQLVMLAGLGYRAPLHGYASTTILILAYHAVHLVAAGIVGSMILSRMVTGRLLGQGYLAEVVGYWWYYVAGAGVVFWLITLLTSI
ncbi:MAG TPA: hypothetical protein VLS53_04855 [Candidatus Dormibacteraeota bacterium]|nr:hypothetical protein [Candidatus Dormibacteraeota bacterium]